MNYLTYLMIKQAMFDEELYKEATDRTAMDARRKARKRGAGRGEAKREGEAAIAAAADAPSVAPVASGAGAIYVKGFDPLQQARVDNAELAGKLRGAELDLNRAKKDRAILRGQRDELRAKNDALGIDIQRANMNLAGMRGNRDALYDAAEANKGFGDAMHRRLLTTNRAIGATGGALAGGAAGYGLSNWASKKLGLQGPNVSKKRRYADIALRTVGTLGGAGLGGYGGYHLGGYLTPANTMSATPDKYVEIGA